MSAGQAGLFHGFEPTNRPDGEARRSYTQLEYELAQEQRRQVFRFIAREDFNGGSFQAYHQRWKEQEVKVFEWHEQRAMKYPSSVATTWQTSFDQLSEHGRGLLNVLCWLASDPIPLTMLEKLSAVEDESPIDLESGIADLAEYSLLRWTDVQHDFVEVHRLVEVITRFRLPDSEREHWLRRALPMANEFVP